MANRDLIVIGTSMGGIEALKTLVSGLPRDLKASLFIVLHTAAHSPGILPQILEHAGPLPVSNAKDWEEIKPTHIYVAPPDYHLLLEYPGVVRITRGPKENLFRPAVDPLFRSAAHAFGPRVIGVILTGGLDDGSAGLWAVKEQGGIAIVQHPEDALAPSMPFNALKHVKVDYCIALKEISSLLVRLVNTPADEKGGQPMLPQLETEVKIAREDNAIEAGILKWGEPSLFACPECHGVLLQLKEGNNVRFRCHTGHAYSMESLVADTTEKTEESLWNAVRSIEESALLLQRMSSHLREHQQDAVAESLMQKAQETQRRAEFVRQAVLDRDKLTAVKAEQGTMQN